MPVRHTEVAPDAPTRSALRRETRISRLRGPTVEIPKPRPAVGLTRPRPDVVSLPRPRPRPPNHNKGWADMVMGAVMVVVWMATALFPVYYLSLHAAASVGIHPD